jgi:hypothetical protein
VQGFLELLFVRFLESFYHNGKNEVQEEKLAYYNNSEAVNGSYYRDINVLSIHYLSIPCLTSDHLKDSEQRTDQIVEISHAEIDVQTILISLPRKLNVSELFWIPTIKVVGAYEVAKLTL